MSKAAFTSSKRYPSESPIVAVLVTFFIFWAVLIIPFKIVGYGYLPGDDALRHTAKAISGKPWNEILVLRDDIKMDSHPGWHAVLSTVYALANWDSHSLILFSVISLFILFSLVPILLLKRPEAWVLTLLVMAIAFPVFLFRILLGRPYIITMAAILAVGLLWPRLKEKEPSYPVMAALTLVIAISVWIHGGWYLFALPLAAFFMARQNRAGLRFGVCVISGTLIGALFTGHPCLFLKQTVQHVFLAFGGIGLPRVLVTEFQPSTGDFTIILIAVLMLMWRHLRGAWNGELAKDPIFILVILCWALGFFTKRFWIDVGLAAFVLWLALEFQDYIEKASPFFSFKRLFFAIAVLAITFMAVTNDTFARWSENHPRDYMISGDKELDKWMPETGGIIYSDSMDIFYKTFFKNPKAPWRYVLGFEPGLMSPDDLKIYRDIQLNYRAFASYEPWIKKMRLQDRLIVRHIPGEAPKIPGLEWYYAADQTWIGRLPRNTNKTPSATLK